SLVNASGATFNIQGDNALVDFDAGTSTFTNEGTLEQTGAAATAQVQVPFTNSGSVEVVSGTLSFEGGGSLSNTLQADSGATLGLDGGTFTVASGAEVSGAGTLQFGGSGSDATTFASGSTCAMSGSTEVDGSTVTFASGSTVSALGALVVTGGTVDFSTGSAL